VILGTSVSLAGSQIPHLWHERTWNMVCTTVCVYVCEREREKEGERESDYSQHSMQEWSWARHSTVTQFQGQGQQWEVGQKERRATQAEVKWGRTVQGVTLSQATALSHISKARDTIRRCGWGMGQEEKWGTQTEVSGPWSFPSFSLCPKR
jgi:hypothetical protein